jgi:PIN domain nuclease of toxin-antitoxin system
VTLILDTHFILWVVTEAARLDEFLWLARYEPWGVSPVSLLEVQFLGEAGRLEVDSERFVAAVKQDPRFVIDELPLLALVEQALPLSWTRDPFDRLLVAHSNARRTPLCTVDRDIRRRHALLPPELRHPS